MLKKPPKIFRPKPKFVLEENPKEQTAHQRDKREQREEEREKISEEMRGEREIFGTKAVGGTVGSEKKY